MWTNVPKPFFQPLFVNNKKPAATIGHRFTKTQWFWNVPKHTHQMSLIPFEKRQTNWNDSNGTHHDQRPWYTVCNNFIACCYYYDSANGAFGTPSPVITFGFEYFGYVNAGDQPRNINFPFQLVVFLCGHRLWRSPPYPINQKRHVMDVRLE